MPVKGEAGAMVVRLVAHVLEGALPEHPQAAWFTPDIEWSWVVPNDLETQQLLEVENDFDRKSCLHGRQPASGTIFHY